MSTMYSEFVYYVLIDFMPSRLFCGSKLPFLIICPINESKPACSRNINLSALGNRVVNRTLRQLKSQAVQFTTGTRLPPLGRPSDISIFTRQLAIAKLPSRVVQERS